MPSLSKVEALPVLDEYRTRSYNLPTWGDYPMPSTYIDTSAVIEGDVTFGQGCFVLPNCRIHATPGCQIRFGNLCIVEESAVVTCQAGGLKFGDYCWVQNQVVVEGPGGFGIGCRLEVGARVEPDVYLPDYCVVSMGARVTSGSAVPERSIIHGQVSKLSFAEWETVISTIREIRNLDAKRDDSHNQTAFHTASETSK